MLGGPKSKWKYSISNITIHVSVESKYPEYQKHSKLIKKSHSICPLLVGKLQGKKYIALTRNTNVQSPR